MRFLITCNSPLRFFLEGRMMPFRREEALLSIMNFFWAYLPSGFYESPKSTLPNGEVYVAISAFPNYPTPIFSIWLTCQVGLYESPKSTLPNGKVHIANSAFPSYQLHITKARVSHCQVHFTLWTAQMSFKLPKN